VDAGVTEVLLESSVVGTLVAVVMVVVEVLVEDVEELEAAEVCGVDSVLL